VNLEKTAQEAEFLEGLSNRSQIRSEAVAGVMPLSQELEVTLRQGCSGPYQRAVIATLKAWTHLYKRSQKTDMRGNEGNSMLEL